MTKEELALHQQHIAITEALIAAKDAYRADPTDKNKAALADAKKAAREFAAEWRGIREYFGVTPVATVEAKASK